jgi:hypothetical protein
MPWRAEALSEENIIALAPAVFLIGIIGIVLLLDLRDKDVPPPYVWKQ